METQISYHFKLLTHYNLLNYNSSPEEYNLKVINDIIFDEKKRIVSLFKDYLLIDEVSDFLRRFYDIKEAEARIPKICEYYYSDFKILPNYAVFSQRNTLIKNLRKKKKVLEMLNNNEEPNKREFSTLINSELMINSQDESTLILRILDDEVRKKELENDIQFFNNPFDKRNQLQDKSIIEKFDIQFFSNSLINEVKNFIFENNQEDNLSSNNSNQIYEFIDETNLDINLSASKVLNLSQIETFKVMETISSCIGNSIKTKNEISGIGLINNNKNTLNKIVKKKKKINLNKDIINTYRNIHLYKNGSPSTQRLFSPVNKDINKNINSVFNPGSNKNKIINNYIPTNRINKNENDLKKQKKNLNSKIGKIDKFNYLNDINNVLSYKQIKSQSILNNSKMIGSMNNLNKVLINPIKNHNNNNLNLKIPPNNLKSEIFKKIKKESYSNQNLNLFVKKKLENLALNIQTEYLNTSESTKENIIIFNKNSNSIKTKDNTIKNISDNLKVLETLNKIKDNTTDKIIKYSINTPSTSRPNNLKVGIKIPKDDSNKNVLKYTGNITTKNSINKKEIDIRRTFSPQNKINPNILNSENNLLTKKKSFNFISKISNPKIDSKNENNNNINKKDSLKKLENNYSINSYNSIKTKMYNTYKNIALNSINSINSLNSTKDKTKINFNYENPFKRQNTLGILNSKNIFTPRNNNCPIPIAPSSNKNKLAKTKSNSIFTNSRLKTEMSNNTKSNYLTTEI